MRIVGSAIFAAFSVGGGNGTDLGNGAAVSAPVLSQPNPPFCAGHATCCNFFLLRYRPGTDLRAAAARLEAAVTRAHCPKGLCRVTTDQRPSNIKDYAQVRDTPLVLGAVLALLAVGTLTHALLTSVHRRRRDLAVLKTLGLLRSQMLGVVFWEASALAAALLTGLPLGVVADRWAWALFAASAGAGATPTFQYPSCWPPSRRRCCSPTPSRRDRDGPQPGSAPQQSCEVSSPSIRVAPSSGATPDRSGAVCGLVTVLTRRDGDT